MDTQQYIQLFVLILLLVLSAFFSSAETALTCVNAVRIRALAEAGSKGALRVEKILENPSKMLSTILIGNNIVNISATSLATTLTIEMFGNYAVGIATGILTLFVLLFGEIIPKTSAKLHAEKFSCNCSFFILKLMFLLTPIIFVVDKISTFLLKITGIGNGAENASISESELKTYVDVSHEEGVIEAEEHEMILNVFDLGDSLARDIMIPRIDMTMVSVDTNYRSLQAIFKQTMFSRIPVYENDTDNIIGIVMLKDFFLVGKKAEFSIRNILRETYYTYETKKTADLLTEMRESSNSVAIVLDEYGASVGLITLEDLLEEIVGEIRDEYDEEEKQLIQEIAPRTYRIDGFVKLDDLNDALGTNFESEDYDSIAGIMIEQLDRLPFEEESITLADGSTLQAAKIAKNRISHVILTLPDETSEDADSVADNGNATPQPSEDGTKISEDTTQLQD